MVLMAAPLQLRFLSLELLGFGGVEGAVCMRA